MSENQLVHILKSLNVYELNSLGKFIGSPYFNTNGKIIIYYEELKNYLKGITGLPSKPEIFSKMYPNEKYNDGRMRYLTSELLKLVEEYFAQQALKKDPYNNCLYSFKGLIGKNQLKPAEKKLAEAEKYLTNKNYPNELYYYYMHSFSSNSGYIKLVNEEIPDAEIFNREAENIIMLMLTIIYQATYNINTLSASFNVKAEYNIISDLLLSFDMEGFTEKLRSIGHPKARIAELYFSLLQLIWKPENTSGYFKIKGMISGLVNELNRQDIYNIITALRSFCIQRELEGKSEFSSERFELNKLSLKLDAYSFSEQRYMQFNDFRNFLYVALFFKEYDWAENFIKEYSLKLQPELRENAVLLAEASVAFHMKDYEKAREYLAKVKPDLLYFKHDVKRMELIICYENGEYTAAIEMIDSYKHFLKSNKGVSELRKDAVWNYLNIALDIVKIKTGESRKQPQAIMKTLEKTKPLANKVWLKDKLNDLIN